jgi:hypothetical protein
MTGKPETIGLLPICRLLVNWVVDSRGCECNRDFATSTLLMTQPKEPAYVVSPCADGTLPDQGRSSIHLFHARVLASKLKSIRCAFNAAVPR